jgi:hypothetical protein
VRAENLTVGVAQQTLGEEREGAPIEFPGRHDGAVPFEQECGLGRRRLLVSPSGRRAH